jgi:hypothetical protein
MRRFVVDQTDMRSATDKELSSTAAHGILRSIAQRAWTKADHAAAAGEGCPLFVDVRAKESVFDDIEVEDERTLSAAFPWRMHADCSISREPRGEVGLS